MIARIVIHAEIRQPDRQDDSRTPLDVARALELDLQNAVSIPRVPGGVSVPFLQIVKLEVRE